SRLRSVASGNLAALDGLFARLSDVLGWVRPRGGMTGFPWIRDEPDSRAFCKRAAEHGILLAPGDCFGMPRHFRIGFGVTEAGFTDALVELESLIRREIPKAAHGPA